MAWIRQAISVVCFNPEEPKGHARGLAIPLPGTKQGPMKSRKANSCRQHCGGHKLGNKQQATVTAPRGHWLYRAHRERQELAGAMQGHRRVEFGCQAHEELWSCAADFKKPSANIGSDEPDERCSGEVCGQPCGVTT